LRAKTKEWRDRNKEKLRADKLAYYLRNRPREDIQVREWRAANVVRVRGYWQDWYYGDLEHARSQHLEASARRGARYRGDDVRRPSGDTSRRSSGTGARTALATSPRLEKQHVARIVFGGTHDPSNVVPACRRCNASKHDDSILQRLVSGRFALAVA
jgi:hypothetical protein